MVDAFDSDTHTATAKWSLNIATVAEWMPASSPWLADAAVVTVVGCIAWTTLPETTMPSSADSFSWMVVPWPWGGTI